MASTANMGSYLPSMTSSVARPLQLDQWSNTRAPLTTTQRASVNRLAEWLHKNTPEYKQQSQRQPASTHSDVADANASTSAAAAGPASSVINGSTDKHRKSASTAADATSPQSQQQQQQQQQQRGSTSPASLVSLPSSAVPLSSAQDFLAWYTSLADSVTSSTQTSHAQALARISDTTALAESLLAQLESCQVNVSELRAGTAFVQDSSRGLREEAQALLDSQLHLDKLSDEITSRLSFFTLLPYATSILSSPDNNIVYTQQFHDLRDQLEAALLFLQQDPAYDYKDAALYRMRYAQCVTRAETLAKMAVQSTSSR
ncbi:hypothetical protein BCV70DRAFT_19559 [Testicularia cyperi]|uniref:Conserved oligomeric Golgi complex subunit 3 N-terminal domain-containing protein n=1 Tax=Testicularia cyperi TaxID=1882483 RepID=A0A317Y037_9BASI|nr:hypothetical protein BCV70DRAFT_19559 [Testicularia cyperi]